VARSEPSDQEMSSYAAVIAASMDIPAPGVVQIRFRRRAESHSEQGGITDTVGEEREGHTRDIAPLTARNDSSTPHIPVAVLVDKDIADERDEAPRACSTASRRARYFAWEFQGITMAESVHALPTGSEEEVATEASASSSRSKYIMIAACISMILVVTVVVATVLLTISTTTELPMIAPTRPTFPPPKKCFETTKELKDTVDIIILDSDAELFLEKTYGLPMWTWCVSSIRDLSELLIKQKTHPAIRRIICERLLAWHSGKPSQTQPEAIPFLRSAVQMQDALGWQPFLEGNLANDWQFAQQTYFKSLLSKKSRRRWVSALIRKLWTVAWD
jgi:hypothetical protein